MAMRMRVATVSRWASLRTVAAAWAAGVPAIAGEVGSNPAEPDGIELDPAGADPATGDPATGDPENVESVMGLSADIKGSGWGLKLAPTHGDIAKDEGI